MFSNLFDLTHLAFYVGIFGILLAIRSYFVPWKRKQPCFSITSNNLISDFTSQLKPLKITFSNKKIENLTVTKIAFWNAGRQTIDNSDIPENEQITIKTNEHYQILDSVFLYKTERNDVSKILSRNRKELLLKFDYFDKDDGVVMQIIHTGKSDQSLSIRGKVKGVLGGFRPRVPITMSKLEWIYLIFGLLLPLLSLPFVGSMVAAGKLISPFGIKDIKVWITFSILVICMAAIAAIIYTKSRIPKEIKKHLI